MAKLRTAMDAAFWDLNISTPLALDGVSKAIPGDPIPLDGARGSKGLRIQQLSLLGNGLPLAIFPSVSPSPYHKELGSFALQSLLAKVDIGNWWVGLIGQLRPKKLISSIRAEVLSAEEWDLSLLKAASKNFLDKSLYAIGLCSQIALTSSTSLLLSTEKHGERKSRSRSTKAILRHQLPDHDITLEAAWPDLFIDRNGKYWEVPESISLDCSSLVSESGLRYRVGVHKNNGLPQAADVDNRESVIPLALLPGMCAKAAFSFEKSKDFWRQKDIDEDVIKKEEGEYRPPPHDICLREPHTAISGIIGGCCEAWFGDLNRLGADVFGSLSYSFQHGRFRENFGDLSRLEARLDISSASALSKRVIKLFKSSEIGETPNTLSSPRLNLIFHQQVYGPIVFRVDSRFCLDSWTGKQGPQLEDLVYSLNYSLRLLGSGKVVAWYSPKRKEGMVELRVFEF